MTDPVDVLVQAAMCDWLTQANLGFPIAYPFVPFTPISGTPFIEACPVMRAAPQNPGLAFTGSNLFRGIFQIDAVSVDGVGQAAGLRMAGLIAAQFAIGTVLSAGPYKLQLNKIPTIAAAVKDAPWVRFPVSIPYLVIV